MSHYGGLPPTSSHRSVRNPAPSGARYVRGRSQSAPTFGSPSSGEHGLVPTRPDRSGPMPPLKPDHAWRKPARLASMSEQPSLPKQPSPPRRMDAIDHPAVSSRRPAVRYSGEPYARHSPAAAATPPKPPRQRLWGAALAGAAAGPSAGHADAAYRWRADPNAAVDAAGVGSGGGIGSGAHAYDGHGHRGEPSTRRRSERRGQRRHHRRSHSPYRLKRVEYYAPAGASTDSSSTGGSSDTSGSDSSRSSSSSGSSGGRGRRHRRHHRRRKRSRSRKHKRRRKGGRHRSRHRKDKKKKKRGRHRSKEQDARGGQWSGVRSMVGLAGRGRGLGLLSSNHGDESPPHLTLAQRVSLQWEAAAQAKRSDSALAKAAVRARRTGTLKFAVAATIIQTVWRGFRVRSTVGVELAMRKQQFKRVTLHYLVDLVDEMILEHFLPDMLLEVFTHKGDEFEAMSPMDRAVHAIADEFITEVAAETTRGCVRASMEDMISSILMRKRTRDEHPLLMVVDDVVDETVTELSREATNTCVQTMVEALMFETHANVWINAAIDPLIREAASEARHEVRVEKMGDWLVGEVVDEMIREAAVSSRREHWRQTRALDKEHQAGLINAAAKRIAHVAALRMMLANLATRGNAVARKEACGRLLKGMMLRHLLARAQQLHSIDTVRSNAFMRTMHEHATTRMTTALLMEVMAGPALDFDEEEIHQRELRADSVQRLQTIATVQVVHKAVNKLKRAVRHSGSGAGLAEVATRLQQ